MKSAPRGIRTHAPRFRSLSLGMIFIDFEAKSKSMELSVRKGSFPNFIGSIYETGKYKPTPLKCNWKILCKSIKSKGIRNATVTTIAPTGTISMIADTSSGIEPQYSLVYTKNVMDGDTLFYVNKHFQKDLMERNLCTEELLERVAAEGSIQHIESIPADLRQLYLTAHDITPQWHIRMQAAFQKHTDNAVSKTINFKHDATKDDVRMAFELAYQLGCKGLTVYRDGSREHQVLQSGLATSSALEKEKKVAPRIRPEFTQGITQRLETGCGHMYITINSDEIGACEVFIQMGKVGGCASAQLEAIARLSSLALRSNIKLESIIRQLKGIRCQSPMWHKGRMTTSCGDAVGTALEQFINLNPAQNSFSINITTKEDEVVEYGAQSVIAMCPDCGNSIEHLEGCLKCPACGWTKC